MAARHTRQSAADMNDDRYVVFPCDLPQWSQVKAELRWLQQNPNCKDLIKKLDGLHHLAQVTLNFNFVK